MTETRPAVEIGVIGGWHAHVYYDPALTRAAAAMLRAQLETRFEVVAGRWHDVKVGPHPQAMYQLAFSCAVFALIVPFLALNRGGLDVLVHPNTGDAYVDHIDHAMWLGQRLALDRAVLRLEV